MATTDFKETGKIKFSDINDLQNNSLTTGNIYASGTSATIGTSDNPFNTVYANMYYGRKFRITKLYKGSCPSAGSSASLSDYVKSYEYIIVYALMDTSGGSTWLQATLLTGLVNFLNSTEYEDIFTEGNTNKGITLSDASSSKYVTLYINSADSSKVTITKKSGCNWLYIYGLY